MNHYFLHCTPLHTPRGCCTRLVSKYQVCIPSPVRVGLCTLDRLLIAIRTGSLNTTIKHNMVFKVKLDCVNWRSQSWQNTMLTWTITLCLMTPSSWSRNPGATDWLIREKQRWSSTLTSWTGEDSLLCMLSNPLIDSLKDGKKKILSKDKKCHSSTAPPVPPNKVLATFPILMHYGSEKVPFPFPFYQSSISVPW